MQNNTPTEKVCSAYIKGSLIPQYELGRVCVYDNDYKFVAMLSNNYKDAKKEVSKIERKITANGAELSHSIWALSITNALGKYPKK